MAGYGGGATDFIHYKAEVLYDFTSAYFTVSKALSNTEGGDSQRTGPTQSQIRSWMTGTSNGSPGYAWANTYVEASTDGYQIWTAPKAGRYRFTAKGGGAGFTDNNHIGRGVKVTADFQVARGEKFIIVAGQGVPNWNGDHCNGGGGASWVMRGDVISTCIPLIVAAGAGGDTSDGDTPKNQPDVTLGSSITVSGVTGRQTTAMNSTASNGNGDVASGRPNSGGWLTEGSNAGGGDNVCKGGGFRQGDLIGGLRSNDTAGYGGFGGGSGGFDENGSASGGFTGAHGEDNAAITGNGSSWVNDTNLGNVNVSLAQATTTFQSSDYTSEDQYQGWVYVQFIS